MAVKLHCCSSIGMKIHRGHPCYRVQRALDEAGVEYERVYHPEIPRSRRSSLIALSGQRLLPVLEFDDGRVLREESKDLAERIRRGELAAPAGGAQPAGGA